MDTVSLLKFVVGIKAGLGLIWHFDAGSNVVEAVSGCKKGLAA